MEADDYHIRLARPDDVAAIPDIERAAARLLPDTVAQMEASLSAGAGNPPTPDAQSDATGDDAVTPVGTLWTAQAAGRLWVAADGRDRPIGFALATVVDGLAHLHEIDVYPTHGRRGIGSALVEAVCVWARQTGFCAITLSTRSDVPWNAPFYARRGFRTLAAETLTPGLVALRAAEAESGLPIERRVVMRRELM